LLLALAARSARVREDLDQITCVYAVAIAPNGKFVTIQDYNEHWARTLLH
jgi:hypothetical protein